MCIFDYESVALIHDTICLFGLKFSMLTRFSYRAVLNRWLMFPLCEYIGNFDCVPLLSQIRILLAVQPEL